MNRKKGIEPTKENNTQTQAQFTKTDKICLVNFIVMVVLIVVGKYINNDTIMIVGMVTGVVSIPFQLEGIFREEDDEDIWE